ncbi:uncharacterized protein LOC142231128 [Haematobia irritans]|uniref:uncharacterized protein LOC142231128 n=1 Tax=Haematobia irritans TaxID=7368 RepID=UPI003F4F5297
MTIPLANTNSMSCVSKALHLICCGNSTKYTKLINRRTLKLIESSKDTNINPCEDFYQYACGNWPQYMEDIGVRFTDNYERMKYKSSRELVKYLSVIDVENSPSFVTQLLDYYKSCLNIDWYTPREYLLWLEEKENLTLIKYLTDDYEIENSNWGSVLGALQKYGFHEALPDIIDEPKFATLSLENFTTIIDAMDMEMQRNEFDELWKKLNQLDKKLKEIKLIHFKEENQPRALDDLPMEFKERYSELCLSGIIFHPNFDRLSYVKAFHDVIQPYDEGFLCKYWTIRFMWFLYGKRPHNFLSEGCMSSTQNLFHFGANWLYDQMEFNNEKELQDVHHIFINIKNQFKESLLKNSYGFKQTTLKFLLEKLDKMRLAIGKIPVHNATTIMETFYQNLSMNSTDFYGNHLQLLALARKYENYYSPCFPVFNGNGPQFLPSCNTAYFQNHGIQWPLYHHSLDDVFKYSAIGSILGHEIFHGFEYNTLLQYATDQMNTEAHEDIAKNSKFYDNHKCLADQYPLEFAEKCSDVNGFRFAYETFKALHPGIYNTDHMDKTDLLDRVNDVVQLFPEFFEAFKCSKVTRQELNETCYLWI